MGRSQLDILHVCHVPQLDILHVCHIPHKNRWGGVINVLDAYGIFFVLFLLLYLFIYLFIYFFFFFQPGIIIIICIFIYIIRAYVYRLTCIHISPELCFN